MILYAEESAAAGVQPTTADSSPASLLQLLQRVEQLEAQVRAYEQNPVVRTLRSLRRNFPQT